MSEPNLSVSALLAKLMEHEPSMAARVERMEYFPQKHDEDENIRVFFKDSPEKRYADLIEVRRVRLSAAYVQYYVRDHVAEAYVRFYFPEQDGNNG